MSTIDQQAAVPIVDMEYPPLPLPAKGRLWRGLALGHNIENGSVMGRYAGPEQAMLVLGPPRSGKTSSIVIPSVWEAPAALVSTSTKPDVLSATCAERVRRGTCYVFDPTGSIALPDGTEELRWSPVGGCQTFDAAVAMAHALAGAGRPGVTRAEAAHWVERGEALLAPLLHAAALGGKTIRDVCRWVLGHDVREPEAILSVAGAQMAKVTLSSVWRTEERERSGIFSTAAGLLSAYRSESALEPACRPNFDPEHFAASSDTVYVCAPAYSQDQLAPLVVALLEQIRAACYLRRRRHPDAAPTLFLLDEVANIAPLPSLPQLASEGVSQGVVTLACLQDLSQARDRWGAAADGFFSLFGAKVIFPGIADHATLDLISALLGDVQVPVQSVSRPAGPSLGWAVAKRLIGGPGSMPDRTPTVTSSTVFRRRLHVDEVYRGLPGHALSLQPTGPGWVPTTPWWSLDEARVHEDAAGEGPFGAELPAAPAADMPVASPSPFKTAGPRVVARSTARPRWPWMVVIPGEPPPPVLKAEAPHVDTGGVIGVEQPSTGGTHRVGAGSRTRTADQKPQARDRVMVRVLGPIEVAGWLEPPDRRVVTELACYLALHPDRNVTGEELRAALWGGELGEGEASAKSLRNAVSLLRKSLGRDLVPEAHKGSGYRLDPGVLCDWTIFSEMVEEANGTDESERLRHALALVRGAPFEGVASGSFTWAWAELFVPRMEVANASAARRLGELALAGNNVDLAVWAVLQGLSASPYDRELWTAHLNASGRSGRDALERAWKSARAVLGDDSRDLAHIIETLRAQ